MSMPTFLAIGVAKAGTTSLYHYLQQHPQIYMSPIKEPHFFCFGEAPLPPFTGPGSENVQARITTTLAAYQALFAGWGTEKVAGEVCTTNFMPRACARIKQYIPDARLIVILRQPAERAYSQFLHMQRVGWEPCANFAQALAAEPWRVQQPWLPTLCHTQPGFYYPILRQYLDCFAPEQLRVYLYEEWQAQPVRILQEIFTFLQVDPHFVPDMQIRHNSAAVPRSRWLLRLLRNAPHFSNRLKPLAPAYLRQRLRQLLTTYNRTEPPPLDPQLRAQLIDLYRTDILQLQGLLGCDLTHWLS